MLFSCGISTGLFFYGVSEPIYHYTGEMDGLILVKLACEPS